MTATKDNSEAWSDFWARQSSGGGNGCMPTRWEAIEKAQRAAWSEFVQDCAPDARLLDIATGDGRVAYWLRTDRPNITAVGIDLAPQLPPAPSGVTVHAGVAMESLPFPDDSFDAVVSQFGIEYGDLQATAKEIDRVLARSGRAGLMVHRGDGPILEHNIWRRTQIEWVLQERDLVNAVKRELEAGTDGLQNALNISQTTAEQGARDWGQGAAAWEIPEAIRRTLVLGGRGPRSKLIGTLDLIEGQARNEIGRINSLAAACSVADDRDAFENAFETVGLTIEKTSPVEEPSGRAFADLIVLARN